MRHFGLGCILLSTALSSSAVSLGRQSGAAVIGRPLDIRVQATLAPGENIGEQCIWTEVLYGDSVVNPGNVVNTPIAGASDVGASIRIQVNQPVNEPIVTVQVQAGCSSPFSRRYVLLADLVAESSSGALPVAPPVAAPIPAIGTPAARNTAPTTASGQGSGSVASATGAAAARAPARAAPRSVVRRPEQPAPAPRLQLEPVDLSLAIDRDPVLRLSLSLLSEPASSEEVRQAASQLWKAINAAPEDVLRDAQKLAVLEAESKGLREQEAQDKARIQALQAELDQSQWQRYAVWGLALLLLVALLLLAWLLRRRQTMVVREARKPDDKKPAPPKKKDKDKAWWAEAQAGDDIPVAPAGAKVAPTLGAKVGGSGLDLDLDLGADDGYQSLTAQSAASWAPQDRKEFAPSMLAASRSVATEELFDVQQQADFFVSLGEHEQAIGVLRSHLIDSAEPSPLAYLDLFRLYHQLGRRVEYDRLREDFNQHFNADAPPFDQYAEENRGLETYEAAFSRIQALWPQPRVLDVIEQSIFRESEDGESEGEVFGLEAYRELLLLYAIAKDVAKREEVASVPGSDFQHTAIRPLKAGAATGGVSVNMGRETQPMDVVPPASPRLGLDVDLDELSENAAFEASLPEVSLPVEPTAKPPAPASHDPLPEGNLIDFEVLDFTPPESLDDKKA